MTGKTAGTLMMAGGVLVGILTIHLWTIVAMLLLLGGAGTRAISNSNRSSITRSRRKSLR